MAWGRRPHRGLYALASEVAAIRTALEAASKERDSILLRMAETEEAHQEQIQALTDLLMNYDQYACQSTKIADRVQPAPPAPAGTGGGST